MEDDSEGILLSSEIAWMYKQMTTSSMAQMGDQQQSTIDNIGAQADDLKEKAAFI